LESHLILSLAAIPALGVFVQIIAAKFNIPSILLLLVSGFLVGPVFGLLDPEHLFGETFNPFVSLSVAVILFEGGLSLKISDLTHTGKIVRNLITLGYVITCLGTTILASFCFGYDIQICLLLGAILAVSGPTVVTPLLRQIKLKHSLSTILRWEGITIDPIGATVSVMIYEIILVDQATQAFNVAFFVILKTLICGLVLGSLGAIIIMALFKKKLIPEFLQEALTFIIVIFVYALSGVLQPESGLLAVTIMGIILANQQIVIIKHIITFKENISVLLLSSLFIMLAAQIEFDQLLYALDPKTILFIFSLIFVIRPLSVLFSTFDSKLLFKEKLFLACLYPRGIVAAAIASIFSLRLEHEGINGAGDILPITFLTIVVTVTFYALIGRPLLNVLGLHRIQKGIMIAGAHQWARELALFLMNLKFQVTVVDTKMENILEAKQQNINSHHSSILTQNMVEVAELSGYGKLLALTKSDEVNVLSLIEYTEIFGRKNCLRISPKDHKQELGRGESDLMLFDKGITFNLLETRLISGSTFELVELTNEFSFQDLSEKYPKAVLIGCINPKNIIKFFYVGHKMKPSEGDKIIVFDKKDDN